jgi:hypothetical protein
MLINHPHRLGADTEALVEPDTLVECDCRDVDSLAVLVPVGKINGNERSGRPEEAVQ